MPNKEYKNDRGRAWQGLAYPESVVVDWLEQLDATHLDIFISPLHDSDVNPDHSKKKPHWHILIMWDNPTTFANAKRVFDSIGAVMEPRKVESVTGAARYLLHLDNPEKYQYERKNLKVLGSSDYEEVIQKTQMRTRSARELYDFIAENNVTSMRWLYEYIRDHGKDDWLHILTNQNTVFIRALISSNAWELGRVHDKSQPLQDWEKDNLGIYYKSDKE